MSSLQTPPSPTEGAQLLALAAAHSPVILYAAATDDDFAPTYISENLESLTGHSVDRMLSRDGYRDRQIHPDDLSGYRQSCSSLGPGDRTKCSYRLRSLDGDYRWYRDDIHRVEEVGPIELNIANTLPLVHQNEFIF